MYFSNNSIAFFLLHTTLVCWLSISILINSSTVSFPSIFPFFANEQFGEWLRCSSLGKYESLRALFVKIKTRKCLYIVMMNNTECKDVNFQYISAKFWQLGKFFVLHFYLPFKWDFASVDDWKVKLDSGGEGVV